MIEREERLHAYADMRICRLDSEVLARIDDALWAEHRKKGARSKRKDTRTVVTRYAEMHVRRRLVQLEDGRTGFRVEQSWAL